MKEYIYLLITIFVLNVIPIEKEARKKYILPISFILIWIFMAIRYDYGYDYLTYMNLFYDIDLYQKGVDNEPLFWKTMLSFDKYYQFIIFQSTVICVTFFYFVRKYISPQYYVIFFLVFICHRGMMLTLVAAMRSSLCAIIFMWGTELFYLRKNKPLLYLLSIYLAYLFHNSVIFLVFIPLMPFILKKIKITGWIILAFVGIIISMTGITDIVENVLSEFSEEDIGMYSDYIGTKFLDSSLGIALFHAILAIPGFFFYTVFIAKYNSGDIEFKMAVLALSIMFISIWGVDFQQRMTVLLFIFYIFSCVYLMNTSMEKYLKYLVIFSVLFYSLWTLYINTLILLEMPDMQGNFLYYHTIFEQPSLP